MQFWTVEEIKHHTAAEHQVDEEIAPGVVIGRRSILRLGLGGIGLVAGLAGFGSARSLFAASDSCEGQRINKSDLFANPDLVSVENLKTEILLSDLVAQLRPMAKDLIGHKSPNERAYVDAVVKLLSRIKVEEPWNMQDTGDGWAMDSTCWMPPLVVFTIRMEPHTKMQLHDHRHYNGVLLCTEGRVRCRNFEFALPDDQSLNVAAGEVPLKGEDFQLRETCDEQLTPRKLSTLTRDSNNIHTLEAGDQGCELIDLFTHFRPDARSYEMEWDEKPVDADKKLYKAAWKEE